MTDQDRARELFFAGLACLEKRDFCNAETAFLETLNLAPRSVPTLNNLAIAQYEQGRVADAATTASRVIEIDPRSVDAYLMLSSCQKIQQRYDDVIKSCEALIAIEPTIAEAHCNLGYALNKTERHQDAIAGFDRAIALNPQFADAHLNRGNALNSLKRFDEAFAAYDRALALNPNLAEAWLGRGNTLSGLKRWDEAFAAYDKALSLRPGLEAAWIGRGNAYDDLKRYDEAVAAYDKALALNPGSEGAWLGRGNALSELKRYDEVFAAYDRALALQPNLAGAWLGRGNAFSDLKRYKEAFAAYDKALALKSDLAEAWLGRGNAFFDLKRHDEALLAYDKALDLKSDLAEGWLGRGGVFVDLKRQDQAIAAFDRALAIRPDFPDAAAARMHAKMNICDWKDFDAEWQNLNASIAEDYKSTGPFLFLAVSESSSELKKYAETWTARKFPAAYHPLWRDVVHKHKKTRIAYVSSDFRSHAFAYLAVGMIESHDKSQFEVAGISTGPDDASITRKRLERAFDTFIDASVLSDDDVARWVREKEIDLLIDLNGHTAGSRIGAFARRPAPIQVNYLGYPGTAGATYIDYIVADTHVIPPHQMEFYTEKIAYLPHCYQTNDRKRIIGDRKFSRAELGLPETGFVFCCFNNNYKILPDIFDSWMSILGQVNDSVLWLFEDNASAAENLRKEAAARGVDQGRLVFAKRMPLADHLARHKLADLFLDTLPYNAHTTASDALWAGLPVLTRTGETFAGRVATSLLTAIGLPELVTRTREDYESLAIELARHPEKLASIKAKLERNRLTTPLFDTQLFTRHIESAYRAMYERYQAGLPPDHLHVPP
jgi:predicted O-linked N-acetylglucosamine transferase (SPINDLY family)